MGRSVWVIEDGEYSDYRVVGVFSSQVNAEVVLAAIKSGTIAEWPLDPRVKLLNAGLTTWHVTMDRDGRTHRVTLDEPKAYDIHGQCSWNEFGEWIGLMGQYAGSYAGVVCMNGNVWAKDAEHAVKIANEIRARAIADGRWPERAAV